MTKQQNWMSTQVNKTKQGLSKFWHAISFRFLEGSVYTKISHFIMGVGQITRKQYVKGILYLFIQIAFFNLMILSPMLPEAKHTPLGFMALVNLVTLGTQLGDIWGTVPGDNSLLMLLYGVFTLAIIFIYLVIWAQQVRGSYELDQKVKNHKPIRGFKRDLFELTDSNFHLTLLTPAIIGIFILTIIPNIFMILVAFTNFGPGHLPPNELFDWVGFDNFLGLFNQSSSITGFWGVLGWTLLWAVIATFSNYILGILLATVINSKLVKMKKLWRTVFVITIAIPQFVSLLLVRQLFSEYGPINEMLVSWGVIADNARINFLGNANNAWTARFMVILINLWVGIPFTMLMTSGILMNVPSDLYEAAEIDGATKGQIFRKITLPYIFFVTTPYLISSFMGNITSFNIIFLLTGGGPNAGAGSQPGDTDLLVTWLFRLTVDQANYSLGAVISILTFILMAIGTLISYRRSKAYKDEGAFQT